MEKQEDKVTDLVCGMNINKKDCIFTSSYRGRDYYFCSEKCKGIFDEDPDSVFAMKAAREDLIEKEREESLQKMVDQIAHEIRNPLTSIGGFTRRVYERLQENDPGKRYMEVVLEDVKRLENMISKLIDLSTAGTFHKEPSDIKELIIETVKSFEKDLADNNIEVKLGLTDTPLIPLNRDKIKKAISALIKNAIEAMEGSPKLLKINTSINDQYIKIAVSDTGKGIPEDKIKYIFDPFFTSKIYGPGLGLTFTRGIIQEHGGNISVESKPGKGATFTIRLPLSVGR